MNKFIRLAAKFYPSSWRQRYGTEFDALLDDTHATWRDAVDVLYGAITMQMSMWSYRNMTVACGLAGLIMAAGLAFGIPNLYVSSATLHLNSEVINENSRETPLHGRAALNARIKQITAEAFSRRSLASIIQRPDLDLYKKDRIRKPLEDVIEQMKNDVKINVFNNNSSATNFVVSFAYSDPVIAQRTVAALIARLIDTNQALAIQALKTADRKMITRLDLLDPASLPHNPAAPNRWLISFIGLGAGALAGILAMAFQRKYRVQKKM
jgi:hypothetical protein